MADENDELNEEPTRAVINLNINDKRIAEAAIEFKEIDAYADLDAAKGAKKVLTKMRTTLGDAHKKEKKQILIDGRRLDGEKNRLLALIAEIEDPISTQLTEIKEKEEAKESERREKITNEIERIKAFANDRHDLTLEQLNERRATLSLIVIGESFFEEFIESAQIFKDEADAKLRIAIVNETEHLAARAEQDKIAEDNAAKQKELDDRQAQMDADEADRKADQDKADQVARDEEEARAEARQKVLDRTEEEQAAKQKELDDEADRVAQAAADKEAAELQAQEEAENEAALLAAAPDVEKLERWAESLNKELQPYELHTAAAKRVQTLALEKLENLITYIQTEARKMT